MSYSESEQQLQLARNLVEKSNILAVQLYPEIVLMPDNEQFGSSVSLGTRRLKHMEFTRPQIYIHGYDVSERLYEMAQITTDLEIDMYVQGEDREEGYHPPYYFWEIIPPTGIYGLQFSLFVPIKMSDSSEDLKRYRKFGSFDLDRLQWWDLGEDMYDPTKNENILLYSISDDPVENLRISNWLFEGLIRAKEVYEEEPRSLFY